MEDIITAERGTELVQAESSGAVSVGPSEDEQRLADEIRQLWAVHVEAKTTVKKTKTELKAIRERLSERLFEMKQLLVKPGRSGGWSSFLRSEGIAKATGDRLVRGHEKTINPEPNMVSEQVSEPTPVDAQRLFESVLPRLKGKLTTPRLAFDFLLWFVGSSHLAHEWQEKGLLVLKPSVETANEPSGGAPVPAPAGQGPAAAVADAGSAAML
jgi:hypothetical protein